MVDMEFENMTINCEDDHEEENEDDPPETQEPSICCRCGRSVPVDEEVFDCDGCPHFTCISCRFQDCVKCIFCKPQIESMVSAVQTESTNLKELYSMYFKRKKFNKDHIVDVELSTDEGSVQKQMCKICKRVFKKSNACYHYTCATGEKPHECIECGQRFVKKNHLESHLNNHYGVRPFKCSEPKCKASFTQKDKLIRHMKSHSKGIKFMCSVCDKLYTSQDILNHHMVKVHSLSKQYKCDQCPRSYKYPSSLRIHRLKHEAKRDYMCEVCGKKYALSAQLKLHKRSHMQYHRRPFKCHCGRRFMSRRDKARHELIHTSCHDFECSLCNTTFGRKDNLERHMKNFHQDNPPILKKHGKLVATVAPFNSKPTVLKKEAVNTTALRKNCSMKRKKNKVEKQKAIKKEKPKVKIKQNKEFVISNMSHKKCAIKSKENYKKIITKSAVKTTYNSLSNINDKELNQNKSVIVSPPQNVPQNRPSVIKSVPNLLPYRILPPDKRFLKMTEEISKGNDHTQTETSPTIKINQLHTQTSSLQNQNNVTPIHQIAGKSDVTSKAVENPTTHNVTHKIPKDNAMNRCFRIIHHTGGVDWRRVEDCHAENVLAEGTEPLEDNTSAAMRPFDGKMNFLRFKKHPTRRLSSGAFSSVGHTSYKLAQEMRNNTSNVINAVRPMETTNNISYSNVGGPSLPTSLSDNVSEINHEDNFTSTYAPMGEMAHSSYTPYFDNEYFRDSMNSYDSNVENLLPNDLDIGFQYINEQLGCSEMTYASESRIIRYVSQETRIVQESYD